MMYSTIGGEAKGVQYGINANTAVGCEVGTDLQQVTKLYLIPQATLRVFDFNEFMDNVYEPITASNGSKCAIYRSINPGSSLTVNSI
ncbi:hypothetical protein E2C01_074905 [Portunus trituberculatus]|uniref:Uncharacterized protein n=1 Tax=Portunus trituberculatus TaxID=210409 RepID=A0A5B7IFH9_PORTR|nr:hypothetical protein [Portunus trituberculatus]